MSDTESDIIGDKPRWAILGAGAIGCLWAAYLRRAGFPVSLITRTPRQNYFVRLQRDDTVEDCRVDIIDVEALNHRATPLKRLLVTTKAHQTIAALDAIRPVIDGRTTLLIVQNGLAARDVARSFPDNTVITGITSDGAYRTAEMTVVHSGIGKTWLGRYDGRPCGDLLDQLPVQYLDIACCEDIALRQWRKLAINCAINGLTAIYHCRNGELLENPEALSRMETLCREIIAVTASLSFPPGCLDTIYTDARATALATAANYSSMYQDIERGRPTEIDDLNGQLCREAHRLGVACPENEAVVAAVKSLESR